MIGHARNSSASAPPGSATTSCWRLSLEADRARGTPWTSPTICSTTSEALHGLTRVAIDDLHRVAGIGRARAAQVLAAVELGRRTLTRGGVERPKLRSPRPTGGVSSAALRSRRGGAVRDRDAGHEAPLDSGPDHRHRHARHHGRSSAGSVSRGNGSGRRGHRALSQSPVRRSGAERRRPDSDQPDAQRRRWSWGSTSWITSSWPTSATARCSRSARSPSELTACRDAADKIDRL